MKTIEEKKTRIAEIDALNQKLWDEKEKLENSIRAEDAKGIVDALATDKLNAIFYWDGALRIDASDKLESLIFKRGGSGYHFSFPITDKIEIRVDDGEIVIRNNDFSEEGLKLSSDQANQMVIEYLISIGVDKGKFIFKDLERQIKNIEENLAEQKAELEFYQNLVK